MSPGPPRPGACVSRDFGATDPFQRDGGFAGVESVTKGGWQQADEVVIGSVACMRSPRFRF